MAGSRWPRDNRLARILQFCCFGDRHLTHKKLWEFVLLPPGGGFIVLTAHGPSIRPECEPGLLSLFPVATLLERSPGPGATILDRPEWARPLRSSWNVRGEGIEGAAPFQDEPLVAPAVELSPLKARPILAAALPTVCTSYRVDFRFFYAILGAPGGSRGCPSAYHPGEPPSVETVPSPAAAHHIHPPDDHRAGPKRP